jgi:hypothetical protein
MSDWLRSVGNYRTFLSNGATCMLDQVYGSYGALGLTKTSTVTESACI